MSISLTLDQAAQAPKPKKVRKRLRPEERKQAHRIFDHALEESAIVGDLSWVYVIQEDDYPYHVKVGFCSGRLSPEERLYTLQTGNIADLERTIAGLLEALRDIDVITLGEAGQIARSALAALHPTQPKEGE